MITLLKKLAWAFIYDEAAAKRWLRGGFMFLGGMAVNVLAFPYSVVEAWTVREWMFRVAAAGALGIAGTITAGQKNRTPEEIRAIVAAGGPPPTP
jgi:hypothetical protein